MKKEFFLSIYYKVSIFFSMGAFLILFLYLEKFPSLMYGDISKSLFVLKFTTSIDVYETVVNSALIVFIVLFLINLGVLIYSLMGEEIEGLLAEGVFYNTILTFLILISHIAYNIQIPTNVNGEISHSLFHSNFFELAESKAIVFNVSYLLITVYLFYSVYVIYKLIPKDNSEDITDKK